MNKELIKELELLRFYKEKGCLDTHYKVLIDYIDELEQQIEKLNHYKKLYQTLKREKEELRSWLEEMLDDEKDIFSVVRVKDVLSKLNELEGSKNDK